MRRLLLGILLFQLWSPNKEEAKERKAKTTSRRKKASLCLRHVLGISFRYFGFKNSFLELLEFECSCRVQV